MKPIKYSVNDFHVLFIWHAEPCRGIPESVGEAGGGGGSWNIWVGKCAADKVFGSKRIYIRAFLQIYTI